MASCTAHAALVRPAHAQEDEAAALRGVLSDRARNDRVHVVSALVEGEAPSTKAAASTLALVSDREHVLVVVERNDTVAWRSARNLASAHVLAPEQLNTYDVLVRRRRVHQGRPGGVPRSRRREGG